MPHAYRTPCRRLSGRAPRLVWLPQYSGCLLQCATQRWRPAPRMMAVLTCMYHTWPHQVAALSASFPLPGLLWPWLPNIHNNLTLLQSGRASCSCSPPLRKRGRSIIGTLEIGPSNGARTLSSYNAVFQLTCVLRAPSACACTWGWQTDRDAFSFLASSSRNWRVWMVC